MNKFYKPLNLNIASFKRQFVLSKDSDIIPDGWDQYEKCHWYLGTSGLPVLDIENTAGEDIGWCIGYPISYKDPWAAKIVIDCQSSEVIDMIGIENFYQETGGRYVLILLTQKEEKIFLDPYGSLSAVFSTSERTVASTPTLLGNKYEWDQEIISTLNMPEGDLWFPLGLTPKKRVKRLLPNHCLDLNAWRTVRPWPGNRSDLTVEEDIDNNISIIISCLKKTMGIIAERYPIQMCLTAGRDTRILLACAREYLSNTHLFTLAEKNETIDMHIASRLANKLGLRHSLIPTKTATDEEMLHWLYLTGHAVGGGIWRIHKTFESFDQQGVVFNGHAAFGVGWDFGILNEKDLLNETVSPDSLLRRYHLPRKKMFVNKTDQWLSEVSDHHAVTVMNLWYLEQKLGSWSAPQFYANTISRFGISPFNHRKIYKAMMTLPYEYRSRIEPPNEICRRLWPELLELPFNEFTGLRNSIHKAKIYVTKKKTRSVNSTKRFVKRFAKKMLPGEI